MIAARVRPTRAGFTLLELLIASGLTATLLLLVWSMFGIYAKLNDQGTERAAELQLVRALIRQFRADLRHLIPEPAQPTGANSANLSRARLGTPASASGSTLPSGASLRGTSTSLEFVIRSTRAEDVIPPDNADQQAPRLPSATYDLVSYRWLAEDSLSASGFHDAPLPAKTVASPVFREPPIGARFGSRLTAEENGLPGAEEETGLVRRILPWLQRDVSVEPTRRSDRRGRTTAAEFSDEPETAGLPQPDRVPEVSLLRFRYFDGRAWRLSWNSQQQQRLPAAIEISFEIEDPERRRLSEFDQGRATSSEERIAGRTDSSETEDRPAAGEVGSVADGRGSVDRGEEPFAEYRFVIAVDAVAAGPRSPPGTMP